MTFRLACPLTESESIVLILRTFNVYISIFIYMHIYVYYNYSYYNVYTITYQRSSDKAKNEIFKNCAMVKV